MIELLKDLIKVAYMWVTFPFRLAWEILQYSRLAYWTHRNNLRILDFIPGVGYVISLGDRPWPVALGENARKLLKWLKEHRSEIISAANYEPPRFERPPTGTDYIRVNVDKGIPADWEVSAEDARVSDS